MVCSRLARVLLLGLLLCTGCATAKNPSLEGQLPSAAVPETRTSEMKPLVSADDIEPVQEKTTSADMLSSLPSPPAKSCGEGNDSEDGGISEEPAESAVQTDQEKIDHALEFLHAAGHFREQGDIESAIDVLDKAYAKLLEVDQEGDPELVQQKEDLRFTISKRVIEAYASRLRTADGLQTPIPMTMNRHVRTAIDLFTGKQRKFFLEAYRRSGIYRPFIVEELREAGLPEELSWLPLIESGFNVRAYSRARALGLWQFIASTGYKFGLKRDRWIDERMDFKKSTAAAIAYLKELHSMFGDWTTALAAYNCGEWAVLKRIRAQRINYLDNFWDLYEKLPKETAFYVPSFLAVLHIVNNPEEHGLTLPMPEEPMETEGVIVSRQVSLKQVGRLIGVDHTVLSKINPALRRGVTPNSQYELSVPAGKGEILLSSLDEIPAWRSPRPSYYVHSVRRGETLSGIAHRYRASVNSIKAVNGLKSDLVRVGARLRIPLKGRGEVGSPQEAPMQSDGLKGKLVTHEVKRGDSLWKIAKEYGTTTNLIISLNHLRNTDLTVGQVLRVPSWPTESRSEKTRTYRVRRGDSPYLIARRYHMDLSDFLSLNKLTPRCRIYAGQELLISVD